MQTDMNQSRQFNDSFFSSAVSMVLVVGRQQMPMHSFKLVSVSQYSILYTQWSPMFGINTQHTVNLVSTVSQIHTILTHQHY